MTSDTLVLSSVRFRPSTLARDAALIIAGCLALAAAAQVRLPLPFTPVPITGQTLALGLLGLLLGSRRGALASIVYLCAGAAGAGVFAGGSGGAAALHGATAGYLFAMPAGAAVCGALAERGWDRRPIGAFAAMLCCSGLVLAGGTLWLAVATQSLARATTAGLYPFVPGELLKALLASGVMPAAWAVRRRLRA